MAEHVKKVLTSNIISLFFAVGAALTIILSNRLNLFFVSIFASLFFGYFLIYILFLSRDIYIANKWRRQMKYPVLYEFIEHNWRVTKTGDFYARIRFTVKNTSKSKLSTIPMDEGYWFRKPKRSKFEFSLIDDDKHSIQTYKIGIYDYALAFLSGLEVNVISWSHVVNPPLMPNEEINYEVKIETPETEIDAFSNEGTYGGIPTTIPTKEASIVYVAPKGYIFNILNPIIVIDKSGQHFQEEEKDISPPKLNRFNNIIEWNIKNLKTNRRYWFKYRLVREN